MTGSRWSQTVLWWRSLSFSRHASQSSLRKSTGMSPWHGCWCVCPSVRTSKGSFGLKCQTAGKGWRKWTRCGQIFHSTCVELWLIFNHYVNYISYLELQQIALKSLFLMLLLSCNSDSYLHVAVLPTLGEVAPVLILCLRLCHALFSEHDWLMSFESEYSLELVGRCCRSCCCKPHVFLSVGEAGPLSEFIKSLLWQD